jgi:hypothetical protein
VEQGQQLPNDKYDLGVAGNAIRSYAGSKFSKELFENFWLGKGVYYMRLSTFQQISDFIEKSGSNIEKKTIELSGKRYFVATYSFYASAIFDKVLGRAAIIFNSNGRPVGLYDTYDFDPKSWGDRSISNETKTRLVNLASRFGTNALPFNIFYGKGSEYYWKYIAPRAPEFNFKIQ